MFIEFVEFKSKHIPELYRLILLRSFAGFFSYTITGFMFNDLGGISIDEASLEQVIDRYLFGVLPDDDPSRIEKTIKNGPALPGHLEEV